MIDTSLESIKSFVEACRMAGKLSDVVDAITDDSMLFYNCELTKLLPESVKGNIFCRRMTLGKLAVHPGERHNSDHITFFKTRHMVRKGFKDEKNEFVGKVDEFMVEPFDILLIKAHEWHEITSLEDNGEFVCVYAVRDHDGFITQRWNGSSYYFC